MTKIIKYFSCCLLFITFACKQGESKEKNIMVTIEPQRYFLEQLVDSLFHVEAIVPSGTSPETFDPSPAQMVKLSRSKAYFAVGHLGFEQEWIKKIKENNPELPVFDNSEKIQLICDEDGHGHKHESNHAHGPIDPHTWSSPKEAQFIVESMYEALTELDPDNQPVYEKNLIALKKKIGEIDSIITDLFDRSTVKSFIIYHPALTYLARDYGLTQYCIENEGKEPSPAQMKELVKTAKETGAKVVFIQEEFDKKNAEVVAKETSCKLLSINLLSYHWDKELIKIAQAISHE